MIPYPSASEQDTEALAARLAVLLRAGDAICLRGPLGAGKSVFARALIRTLCGDPDLEVPSPTFTLVQTYETKRGALWHFDLYRLKSADEIYEIGWEEALGSGALILVEWPERLQNLTPANRLDIDLASGEADSRTIAFTPHGTWKGRDFP